MQIRLSEDFENNFEIIFRYIAADKMNAAKNFKKELFGKIINLPDFPYKNRKSIYFNDDDIRDMIFKGYTTVYKIDMQTKTIHIVDIFNKNKPTTHPQDRSLRTE
jgi:plasmid stabilization system protein ParE